MDTPQIIVNADYTATSDRKLETGEISCTCSKDNIKESDNKAKSWSPHDHQNQSSNNNNVDLSKSLCWIKSQMKALKQTDKALMEQFVEIRTKLTRLRQGLDDSVAISDGLRLNSASDPSITESSREDRELCGSLPRAEGEDYFGEFRGRSVSMLPSRPHLSSFTMRPQENSHKQAKTEEFF